MELKKWAQAVKSAGQLLPAKCLSSISVLLVPLSVFEQNVQD